MAYLQWLFWIVGLTLQVMVLSAMLRGAAKRFPIIFAYTLVLVCTTITDILASVYLSNAHRTYARYYWLAELIRQSGLFSVVVSLVMTSIEGSASRVLLTRTIVSLSIFFWGASMLIHANHLLNLWMTRVVRDLSFCSAIVNLFLWFVLISRRERNFAILLVSGGLGLQMTGEAIGQAVRQIRASPGLIFSGNILIVLTHFLCLYIWWQAFQRYAPGQPVRVPRPELPGGEAF